MAKKQVKKIEYAPSARQRKAAEQAKADKAHGKNAIAANAQAQKVNNVTENVNVTNEATAVAAAQPPKKKKQIWIIALICALVVVLVVTSVLLIVFNKKYPSNGAYATFRLEYADQEYVVTYELKDVSTKEKDLGTAIASFVSWTNKGVYNNSVMQTYTYDWGCLDGGEYKDAKPNGSGGFTGTKVMTELGTKNTSLHDYYYSYSATSFKDKGIYEKYNLSVRPYSGSSMTYRWFYRMCLRDGKSNLGDITGYVIGSATDGSKKAIDQLCDAVEREVDGGIKDLTPVKVKSVSIDGNRRMKWQKYDFFSNHSKDDYKRMTN